MYDNWSGVHMNIESRAPVERQERERVWWTAQNDKKWISTLLPKRNDESLAAQVDWNIENVENVDDMKV